MNCRSVRREIDEGPSSSLLSASADDHLKSCSQCTSFREDRLKLREMLSSLGSVEAPGDFDFRLRARLANEKRGAQPFVMRNLSFGFRSAAVAASLLLIGSALLLVSLRTTPTSPLSANGTHSPAQAIDQSTTNRKPTEAPGSPVATIVPPSTDGSGADDLKTAATDVKEKVPTPRRTEPRRTGLANMPGSAANEASRTRELASTPAKVMQALDPSDPTRSKVFPIGASQQSLKVSLDDGRGSSRTISLPTVSFGSQRVLAPAASTLMASARSDW
ncbi:MAG TPA: hypothetical protein VMS31_15545 [Pyrinomonadaceae bacterium]|nr:hypothetical protein [Pyrinomonadaceae bacterium]